MTLQERWTRPAGYRDVLRMAVPLVLSTSSLSIQQFVDRMYLAWYSPVEMAAAMPASLFSFTIVCFFMGTASYANAFVAQYYGAQRPRRIGPAVWQAIWFSCLFLLVLPVVLPLAAPALRAIGHAPRVQALELRYFNIIMIGGIFSVYNHAAMCLYTGLGRNWPVTWVNFACTFINIVLDYAMIFGHWGFPEMGIAGAAWATNIATAAGSVALTVMLLSRANEREFATRSGWRLDPRLFARLMRFGAPSGLHFMLDLLAFSLFIAIVGRLGTVELAATTLAFQINTLAFMPMIGFGIATSTLVGQWLGRDQPDTAARATWSAFHLTIAYMTTIALLYVVLPDWFIAPFATRGADAALFERVRAIARVMLMFVAFYSVFDTLNIIFASALKGAGDTRFVMIMSVCLGWLLMVLPTWFLCAPGRGGVYTAWTFLTLCVIAMGFNFLFRFLHGKWRSMRVIESPPVPISDGPAESPADLSQETT